MINLHSITELKSLMNRHGISFRQAFGQNFLINPSVCPKMAEAAIASSDVCALEIGPGAGVLTRELSSRAKKVVSVEIDRGLIPVLSETLSDCSNVKVINGDFLRLNLHEFFSEHFEGEQVSLCANLPYYITSPLIMAVLESRVPVSKLVVMVQKEAAERLCAEPGHRRCGAVSAAVRFFSNPKILFTVPRGSFFPAPNVDSAVIELSILKKPPVTPVDESFFFKTVKAAFSMRRKTLTNCLSSGLDLSKDTVKDALRDVDISESARAEELSLEKLAETANAMFSKISAVKK